MVKLTPSMGMDPARIAEEIEKVRASDRFAARSSSLPTWCPGCGYFGITHALTSCIHKMEKKPDEVTFVSGIGCAGRFPYFMRTYGFHTVHGRALPVATGLSIANPDLTIFAVGGDGDGVGIGGGHLPHAARRNVNIVYVLFDNAIYGLTKGQVSPTSPTGFVSKTTPYGNIDSPINPLVLALSYGATFAARGFAGDVEGLEGILIEAVRHQGFSFIHVLTPCVTFDKVNSTWDHLWERTKTLPNTFETDRRPDAIRLAMEDPYSLGIFIREERPTLNAGLEQTCKIASGG
jgi:2-oxoglutarate ferredoxin oxidoreductase subunit beta